MRHLHPIVAAMLVGGLACAAGPPVGTQANDVRVLSSNGVKAVLEAVLPDMEDAVGRPLSIEFSTAASLKDRIAGGEAFDVAILTPALVDELVAQQRISSDSRLTFARSGVGVGARAGAPEADVSSTDTLKTTLLAARSVAMTADGQSRRASERAFEQLGIADVVQSKILFLGPGEGPRAVAAGEAELVLTLVSEIVSVPGLQLLGPFPDEVQSYVSFTAGASSGTGDPAAAGALLRFLQSPAVSAAARANGMEIVHP